MKKPLFIAAIAIFLLTIFFPNFSGAAVWVHQNEWNADWEDKYAAWIKKNLNIHYFAKEGTPYTGLKIDCADAVYSMRAIFAFENKLPLVFKDSTGGKNKISNVMSRWDHLPEEKRIRSFLNYLFQIRGTEIMPEDTYPVAIDAKNIRSGTIILTDHASHHSWTIQDINDFGLPHLVFSSRPAKTIILEKVGYPSFGFTFPKGNTVQSKAGFRAFRHPEFIGAPVWKVPGYSEDVYKLKESDWPKAVQSKLAKKVEDYDERLQRLLKESCDYARDRVNAVNDALTYLASMPASACMDATKYDDYSTPNRDKRLKDIFLELDAAIAEAKEARANISAEVMTALKSLLLAGDTSPNAFCSVEIASGKNLSLSDVRNRSYNNSLSNNPHDPLEYRWGSLAGHSPRAQKCPVY